MQSAHVETPEVNWWILGGSLAFLAFSVVMGLADFKFSAEIVFAGSMGIVLFLMRQLTRDIAPTPASNSSARPPLSSCSAPFPPAAPAPPGG